MAEQCNGPLVTPEKNKGSRKIGKNAAATPGSLNSGRITRRSSTGSYDNGENARRNSSEKRDSANNSQHAIPPYLRASTGSCHDICKYGRRHAFKEKATIPLRKRTAKPSLNELNSIEMVEKHEPSEDTKKHSLLVKPSPDAKSFLPKVKASFDAKTHPRRLNASSSGKARSPNSPTKISTSPETPEIIKREMLLPEDSIDNKMPRADKKTSEQSATNSSSVRSKPAKSKSSSASENSDGVRRNRDVQTGGKMRASMESAKKTLIPAAAPLFPKCSHSKKAPDKARKSGSVKLLSPGKDQNRIDGVETETSNSQVSEKTLHVVKIGTGNNPLESVPDNHGIPALASPLSLVSLSHANPTPLFHEEDDEGIECSGNVMDEFANDNAASMEIGDVKPVKENQDIPALASPSSPVSFSHENPSSIFHVEDVEEIKYSAEDADEYVTDNIVSLEIDKVQPVKENHNETLGMGTVPALPSSSKSMSRGKSPSMLPNKEVKHIGKKADKRVSGTTVTVQISKAKSLKGNHDKNLRKDRVVSSGDKYCRPVKLKFRSGKVVNPHQDNNVPTRVRFRRIRVNVNKADVSVSKNKKSVEIGNIQPVKKNNQTLRKSRVVVSEDKSRSPVRLFRGEKGVNLQSDNNIPWRLSFRRAKILEVEDGRGDSKRISKNAGGGADLSSQKVNLKHQDLQGKKDAQCLFNNVIEETASKLVESRKSKVKALVGAFETVISLQEGKPSSHTAT